MQRIVVIGNSGSGKSTLARRLSAILGIPAVHLDTLRFVENESWVSCPKEEFRAKIAAAVATDAWIFEGVSAGTLPLRLERCDTIVFLDYNRFFCAFHAIKRRMKIQRKPRPELPKSCVDKIDKQFLKWILLDYPNQSRPRIVEMIEASGKPVHRFTTRRAMKRFLAGL
ncbi:MAG: AAA family ATPase [Oscillospiraceae bacterium]|nr:AAA family ATPase [Oscillospiraceae bacterium]